MAVQFFQMPSANRVPGPYVEVDGTNALGIQAGNPHRVLLLGLKLAGGTAVEGQIYPMYQPLDGDAPFGANSQLSEMVRTFKRVNTVAAVFAMALNEASGGVAATGSILFAGTTTKAGPLTIRVGDKRITASLPSNTAAAAAVTALNTAYANVARTCMTAAASTATLNLTARSKGTHGNEVTVAVESMPPGLTATVTQPSGGATDPDVNVAVTALDEQKYDTIVTAFSGAANMLILENEMERRWGPLVKQPGMIHASKAGTPGTLSTYGSSRNSQYSSVMGSGLSPTPPWTWAAQTAARDAQASDTQNPNAPRNGLTLPDCEAPPQLTAFDALQRNLLLYDGISTYKVDQSGRVSIERLITTYQVNTSGQDDATYLSIETLRLLALIYNELLQIGGKYGRHLLAPDGTNAEPGTALMTPGLFRGVMIGHNDSLERRALTYDAIGFETDLVVEIDPLDKNRLNANLPHRLVGGLVTLAMKISFQL